METAMRILAFATVAAVLASAAVSTSSGAAGFCKLPDGSMGQQCVVATSGQVYGCVKDLKDCGALSPTAPSSPGASSSKDSVPPSSPAAEDGQKITKSRSNIQNN